MHILHQIYLEIICRIIICSPCAEVINDAKVTEKIKTPNKKIPAIPVPLKQIVPQYNQLSFVAQCLTVLQPCLQTMCTRFPNVVDCIVTQHSPLVEALVNLKLILH